MEAVTGNLDAYTYGEACVLYKEKQALRWEHTTIIISTLTRAICGAELDPTELNPYREKPIEWVSIEDLKRSIK